MASAGPVVISIDDSPLHPSAPQGDGAGTSRAASAEPERRRRRSQQGSTTTRQAQNGNQDVVDLTALDDTADDDEVVLLRVKPGSRAPNHRSPSARGHKRQRQPTPVSGASASAGAVAAAAPAAGAAGAPAAAAAQPNPAVLQQPGLPPLPVPGFYAQQQQQQQAAAQEATGSSPAKGFGNCPICLDKMDHPSSTPCGHLFCEACIKAAIKTTKKCPKCRKTVQMKQIHRIYPDA